MKELVSANRIVFQILHEIQNLLSSAVMSKNSSKYNFSHDFWPAWTFKCNKRKFKKNCEKLRHRFAQQAIAILKVCYSKKSKNGYQDRELQVEMVFFWGNWLIYHDGNSFKKEKKYLQIAQVLPVFVTVTTFTSNKHKKFK